MKRILLSSACIVAFAGAAAAEGHTGVTFSGDAELGFNDTDIDSDGNDSVSGFYSELDVTIGFAAELDNGLTAAASIDFEDLAGGGGDNGAEYELSLTSEDSGLYYGDTNFAAQNVWVAAGDMESDNFSEADGEEALRAELSYGGIDAQMSYVLAESGAGTRNLVDTLNQLSLGVSADLGNFNVVMAYQEESGEAAGFYGANGDFTDSDVFGLSVGTSFSGADVRFAYAENNTSDSMGIQVAYPVGPVTATVYFVSESVGDDNYGLTLAYEDGPVAVTFDYDNDQGVDKIGLEGSYDVGNGLVVYAGYLTEDGKEDAFYVGGEYDLGSGASLLVSYADADSEADDDDDVGAQEYQVGTTVELSFEF